MRIAWASPIDVRSAIGRVSADVTRALIARGHEVRIIATEVEVSSGTRHATPAEVVPWRDFQPHWLKGEYDVLVANIGDHFGFHGGVFPFFGQIPTLGVFHDFYLYDLFNGWLLDEQLSGDARGRLHDAEVAAVYGPQVVPTGLAARSGQIGYAEIAAALPMTEWMARRCEGAVAHSEFYLERLNQGCPGPVRQAYMPVSGRGVPALALRAQRRVALLTVGVMNPNKCVDQMLHAIGQSDALKQQVAYRLVGPIHGSEADRLRALASQLGYDQLTIVGAVDEETLAAELAASDVISCLRKPILEGASGSAIEALMAGRPTIVADAGFYRELPDEWVFKVGAEVEPDQLRVRLEQLVGDEALRIRAGAGARAWAEQRFNLDDYAETLERAMTETIQASAVLAVSRRIGSDLAQLGLQPNDPALPRIAGVLSEILPG